MTYKNINLVKDTINKDNINNLIEWLKTNPRLTKGDLTVEFEKKWSEWLGVKYSVFINSGSSANLAMIYSLILSGKLKNNKIIVPAVSWVTTVTPAIQFGLEPILCDCDENNLGLDLNHLKSLIKEHNPSSIILVHVLGIPNHMNEIIELCQDNDIFLLEDTCEALGSEYYGKRLGSLGLMSSFSFYFGHHMSTIEGGMVCTNDEEFYHLVLSIRSHGWDRDLPEEKKKILRNTHDVNNFRALYTFYYPGFNLRSTDLQAFIGLDQMNGLPHLIKRRNDNYNLYNSLIKEDVWKIKPPEGSFVCNFNYPIITRNIDNLILNLQDKNVECRPLICGSINEQPFWYKRYGKKELKNSELVHHYGMYLPNHAELEEEDIRYICDIVNNSI